jgi:hypothetical protein
MIGFYSLSLNPPVWLRASETVKFSAGVLDSTLGVRDA